jgi:hypothetical protein
MGLAGPPQVDEDAMVRSRKINSLGRVFNGAVGTAIS